MKKLLIYLLIFSATLGFVACEKEGESPTVELKSAPSITAPANGTALVLEEANAEDTITIIKWSAADYGYQAAITYKVELAAAGTSFATIRTLGTVTTTELPVKVSALNTILINLGYNPFQPANFEVRIVASVNALVPQAISAPINLTITPYIAAPTFPLLNVPGSYQGWDPAKPETTLPSVNSNEIYEGYLHFPDANTAFKFAKGSWDTNWGDDGADGTLEPGGADIVAADAGVYKLNVDLNGLTYSKLRTEWGLIGSATPNGGDADQNMTYDPANNSFTITLDLVVGAIKFRANDDWALNYGDNGADGKLEEGGTDIAIEEAGNYTITLDLRQTYGYYSYKITKN